MKVVIFTIGAYQVSSLVSGLSTWNRKNNSDKISIRRDSTTEKTASASDLDEVSTSSENVEGSKEPHSTAFDVPGDRWYCYL